METSKFHKSLMDKFQANFLNLQFKDNGDMNLEAALYLVPVNISDGLLEDVLPERTLKTATALKYFIVENIRTARRFLKKCDRNVNIDEITFFELNEHTDLRDVDRYLDPLRKGDAVGVMSEAGCPGIADPGSPAVAIAQREGFKVIPLVGPSSLLLSLMASGFNGQSFSFNGYLPLNAERERKIRRLEEKAYRDGVTQIFIETPYRNNKLIETLSKVLRPETLLCVASGITDPGKERIITMPAREWRTQNYDYGKIPTIFLIYHP